MSYRKVHFRLNTPSYYKASYGVGFGSDEDKNIFFDSITAAFINDGWKVIEAAARSGVCPRVQKDKQELYLHPQDASGVVNEENINNIAYLLSSVNGIKCDAIDQYDYVFDITEDEYLNILENKKIEIENDILTANKTKRKNLVIPEYRNWDVLHKVLNKYKVIRLDVSSSIKTSEDIDYKYVFAVFNRLCNEKKILCANLQNGIGFRTAV
jgi:hypothetical protein